MVDEVKVDEAEGDVKMGVADQKLGLFGLPDLSGIFSLVTLISSHMDEIKAIIANVEALIALVSQVTSTNKAKMSLPGEIGDINAATDPPIEDGK